jgi:SAM-dependent methyltransferase
VPTIPADREQVSRCPVCLEKAGVELFEGHDWLYGRPGTFPLVRCGGCGLCYLRERPSESALGAFYPDDSYYAYKPRPAHALFRRGGAFATLWYAVKRAVLAERYRYRHLAQRGAPRVLGRVPLPAGAHRRITHQLEVLMHPFVPDGSLLEVGCGSGAYLDLMRALGWSRVVGVDFSSRAVSEARAELGLEAYCGDLRGQGFPSESFHAASLCHTLEHVADPVDLLREIRRVLKPGGRVAIIVPNAESLAARVFGEYCLHFDPPRHLVNFTKRSLSLAFDRAGLQIDRLQTSTRGAYQVALFSHSRRAGDPPTVYKNDQYRFAWSRRFKAAALSACERTLCAFGRPAGEEVMAVALRAS